MRRALIAMVVTVAGVVAVLSYHSPPVRRSAAPAPVATAPEIRTYLGPRVHAADPGGGVDYGIVQVSVQVRAGEIVDIRTPVLPPDGDRAGRGTWATSGLLSQGATKILIRKVLAAQSTKVHAVSGATWTSDAFVASLQAALLQASR